MPGVDGPKLLQIVERVGGKFSHLLVIPDLFGFATLGVPAKNLGGILGVEVRQQLLLPGPRLAKRVMDAALTSIGVLFVLPFLVLIALLIKLDSKGPIFYSQNRLGKDGEFFKAYKFRTMHGDGEERLKAILDARSAAPRGVRDLSQAPEGPARHPDRARAAEVLARRVPAAAQRHHRRHEPRRPAPVHRARAHRDGRPGEDHPARAARA